MAASSNPTFTGLAALISDSAKILERYLASSDQIPRPTLGPDSPPGFPAPPEAAEIHGAREQLLEAIRLLQMLALGPAQALFFKLTHVC